MPEKTPYDYDKLFDLTGKVAVVTGGSRGIGKAISIGLAHYGADVCIGGLSKATEETVSIIKKLGKRSIFVPTDVSRLEDTQKLVSTAQRELGGIDILVNNAGIAFTTPAEDVTPQEWDNLMVINLRGLFFMCQAAGRAMINQGRGGRIINISSIFGIVGSELGASVYRAAKGGVVNLSRALACEWAKHRILVNSIGPGFIATDMTQPLKDDPGLGQMIAKRHPLGRFGEPIEVVGAAIFLASPGASFVTGQTLFVDGGYTSW